MNALASFLLAAEPVSDLIRIGVVAAELDARRLADVLARAGFRSVSCYRDASDLVADAVPKEVVVLAGHGSRADELSGVALGDTPIVLVAGSLTRRDVDLALEAGVRGFVAEEHLESRLAATVLAVASGQLVIPWEAREAVARPVLSTREKQILSMVVLGFSNVEIASKLFIAETTVKSHLYSAYRKLGVRSRQEAAALILDASQGLGLGILAISDRQARTNR